MLLQDCIRPGQIDVYTLSLLFTEELIRKCFAMNMQEVDKKGKQVVRNCINLIFEVNGVDISSVDGACERLLSAVTVCFSFPHHLPLIFVLVLEWFCDANGKEESYWTVDPYSKDSVCPIYTKYG